MLDDCTHTVVLKNLLTDYHQASFFITCNECEAKCGDASYWLSMETAASATRLQISGQWWIDGWMDESGFHQLTGCVSTSAFVKQPIGMHPFWQENIITRKWKIIDVLCTLCPDWFFYAALCSNRWRRNELISSPCSDSPLATTECLQVTPSVGLSSSWDGSVYSAATFPATVWSQFNLDLKERERQQTKENTSRRKRLQPVCFPTSLMLS